MLHNFAKCTSEIERNCGICETLRFPKNSNYSAYPFETALDLMAFVRNRTRFWTDWYAPDEYNGSIPVGHIKFRPVRL